MNALVWWLTQEECEAIGPTLPKALPTYLRDQYRSRLGRAGHGRLWADAQFAGVSIRAGLFDGTPLGRFVGARCGGVVIRAEDAARLKDYPGLITDLDLKRAGVE